MADKDINVHVRAKGVEESKDKLDRLTAAMERMSETLEKQSRPSQQAADDTEKLTAAQKGQETQMGKLWSQAESLAKSYLGMAAAVAAVTRALQLQAAASKEGAEVLAAQQNSALRLQFLGDYFEKRPELRKEIGAKAEQGRRQFNEVADAWYNLNSKNASLSESQRSSILDEALEMGRTDPSLPLNALVDMFSLYAKKSGEQDANRIQNVLQQTITEAGGSGEDVANYMPRFLPIGISGGLTPAQSAGLWAYATTQESEASIATTGIKAIMLALQGKGTPESQEMLDKFGVKPEMDFFKKIETLGSAYDSGAFGLGQAEQLAQREGASMLLSILGGRGDMMRTVNSVVGVDRGDIDLTRTKINKLFGTDKVASDEEDSRQLDIKIQNVKANEINLARENAIKKYELMMREAGQPEFSIWANTFGFRAVSADPETIESWGQWHVDRINANNNRFGNTTIINKSDIIYQEPGRASGERFGPAAVEND